MSPSDHPRDRRASDLRLATEAPLAKSAVAASLAGVILGFTFIPQLLGLAIGGISLVREPGARSVAAKAIAIALACTIFWGVVLGLLLKWWASSRA